MTAASVNGITIEYDVGGDNDDEPLLLIMGLGGQLTAWPPEFVERFVTRDSE
jgi:pimeloyl-ACP methyl ester carboxylesterase